MIRLLNETDRAPAIDLLEASSATNLYLLGNMESLGFDADFCQFWGDFGEDSRLRAVLNRYMSGWTIYGLPSADWSALAAVIDNHPIPATRLQDNPGGIDSLIPYLHRYDAKEVHTEQLMTLDAGNFHQLDGAPGVLVRRAEQSDVAALVDLFADAGQMTRSPEAVKRPLNDTRIWLAEIGGEVRSVALTNAETSTLAMIGGVFTPPAWRGRGLSQAVCSALCAELLAEGKRPVLYWDTPAAGAIYRKLGFHDVGQWRSVWLEKNI